MKKFILNTIFIIYFIIAVFVTVCLLAYNDFKITEFGNYSLVIVSDEKLTPDFQKGDLLIIKRQENMKIGQKAFFYSTSNRKIEIRLNEITDVQRVTETESTYTLEENRKISSEYVLGCSEQVEVIPIAGTILGILESKFGFLFIIVLPSLLAFFYQITVVISEIKDYKNNK